MMTYCPHCGHNLPRPLMNGITSCLNCRRVCDSTRLNRLISLGWVVRKQHLDDLESLVTKFAVTKEDAELVVKLVSDECYNPDEFRDTLRSMNLKDYHQTSLDRAS